MNLVIISGNLGRDPEMRYTPEGKAVTQFSVAVNMGKDKDPEWFNVVAWEKVAESVAEYARKGKKVLVQGSLKTEKYKDKEGVDRYITKVIARNVEFLSPREADPEPKAEEDFSQLPF